MLRYKIDLPLCVRYFSEPEIMDMLVQAGFKRVDLWYADYEEHNVYKLDRYLAYETGATADDREPLIGNLFAAVK